MTFLNIEKSIAFCCFFKLIKKMFLSNLKMNKTALLEIKNDSVIVYNVYDDTPICCTNTNRI